MSVRNIPGTVTVHTVDMELAGRLHPLLVHFPIGLVLLAALAELTAAVTLRQSWHVVAVANVRAGALFAIGAAIAGWLLARAPGAERPGRSRWIYRASLFGSAAAVAVAGHLGGVLVWGADFFHP